MWVIASMSIANEVEEVFKDQSKFRFVKKVELKDEDVYQAWDE